MSSDPTDPVTTILAQVKGTLSETQAAVEGLASFFRERAQLEETYARSLSKLARNSMAGLSEKALHPDLFEALASLRGDAINEGVQHSELAANINRDVLEPLTQLRDASDTVLAMSNECKRVTRDVRAAYDRCRKLYTKYVGLHKRAAEACAGAGVPPPQLWVPGEAGASAAPVPVLAPAPTRAASKSTSTPATGVVALSGAVAGAESAPEHTSDGPHTAAHAPHASLRLSPVALDEAVAAPSHPWSLELQPAHTPESEVLVAASVSADALLHHQPHAGTAAWESASTASDAASLSGGGGSASLSGLSSSGRFKLGSGLSLPSVPLPSSMGAANVTTAQRIASMQGAAQGVAQAAEAARVEAQAAWEAYASARQVFSSTVAGTVSAFREIDRRRAAEMCDSVRKFTIFQASCLANLQYDVQRLAPKVEAASDHAVNQVQEPPATVLIEEAMAKSSPLAGLLQAAAAGAGVDSGYYSPSAATPTPGGGEGGIDAFQPGPPASRPSSTSGEARRFSVDRGAPAAVPAPHPPVPAASSSASSGSTDASHPPSAMSEGIAGLAQRSIGRRTSLTGFLSEALSVPHAGSGGAHPPPHSSPLALRGSSRPSSAGEHGGAVGLKTLFNRLGGSSSSGGGGLGSNLLRRGSRDHSGGGNGALEAGSPHKLSITAGGTLLPPGYDEAHSATPSPVGGGRRGTRGGDSPAAARGPLVNAAALRSLDFLIDACFDPAGEKVTPSLLAAAGYGMASGEGATPASSAKKAGASEEADMVVPTLSLSAFAGMVEEAEQHVATTPATPPPRSAVAVTSSPSPSLPDPATPLPDLGVALNPVVLYLLPRAQASLYAEPSALAHLVHALDLRRGGGSGRLSKPSLDALSALVNTALDVAQAHREHALIRAIMVLSQAYYCALDAATEEDGDEVDLLVAAAALSHEEASAAGEAEAAAFAAKRDGGGSSRAPGTPRASLFPQSAGSTTPVRRASAHDTALSTPPPGGAAASPLAATPPPSTGKHPKKLYLQSRLRHHPVWQDESYWEFAVYDTVGQEMSKLEPGGAGGERERDVTYGQLGFFAYTMVSFAVPKERVAVLLEKYAKLVRLSEGQWGMLLASLAAFEAPPAASAAPGARS